MNTTKDAGKSTGTADRSIGTAQTIRISDSTIEVVSASSRDHAMTVLLTDPFCHSAPARCQQWAQELGRPHWFELIRPLT